MITDWIKEPTNIDKYIPKDVQEALTSMGGTLTDNFLDATW
jgi:hypothetical protein